MKLLALWLGGALCLLHAQAPLERAYELLRTRQYDESIAAFRQSLTAEPGRVAVHKDLAYTYLKVGDTVAARDEFATAMHLAPDDLHLALEFAFLANETKQVAAARRIFERVAKTGDPESRATASQAFENIDRPLREGIERWKQALAASPGNFSAHKDLAGLAEQRDELPLALMHYEAAWKLKPAMRSLLVDMGRVARLMKREEQATTYLIAASRGAEPRAAEEARDLLGSRYPYVYEFQRAIELDPTNAGLRRELGYLYIEMKQGKDAEREFSKLVELLPDDLLAAAQLGLLRLAAKDTAGAMPLLKRALEGPDEELADRIRTALGMPQTLHRKSEVPRKQVSIQAKTLAERSLQAGYLQDALKYLNVAHETDPLDFSVILKLGWTNNILKDDPSAVRWFRLASKSPEPAVAAEANRAYRNLEAGLARIHTSVWMYPIFSTRWHDLFAYGQVKTELRIPGVPVHPYFSTRFVGDARGGIDNPGSIYPQYLSESSIIFALGLATVPRRGLVAWGEAGMAMSYLGRRPSGGFMKPDYRGGLSFSKGFGRLLTSEAGGAFFEMNLDAVFVSRFQNDTIFYSQNRAGWTFAPRDSLGGFQLQLFWNANLTADAKHQYWANFGETGPGLKFRFASMPRSLYFTVSLLRGAYTVTEGNPRGPQFNDLRAGIWYAH
ncbi:MAG: tetratricopeptide repeat protein [Bryobacteraceae bacterium]